MKSGAPTLELSGRDQFMYDTFLFLRDHIVRQEGRVARSFRSKLSLKTSSTASALLPSIFPSDSESDPESIVIGYQASLMGETSGANIVPTTTEDRDPALQTEQAGDIPPLAGSVSQVPKGKGKGNKKRDDTDITLAELIDSLHVQQKGNTNVQGQIENLMKPSELSNQTMWCSWMGGMANKFRPSVLTNFYTDCFSHRDALPGGNCSS